MTKFAFGIMAVLLVGIGIFAYLQHVERIKLEARIEAGLLPEGVEKVPDTETVGIISEPVEVDETPNTVAAAEPEINATGDTKDVEIARLKEELEARRDEEKALGGKLQEMTAEINRREAETLRKEKEGEDQLTPLQQKIQLAPSVGKLQEFKPEWAFGVIDAGSEQGISVGDSFALRNGADLVAVIEISEVQADRSVCNIVPQTVSRGFMPEVGNEVINMPPY